MASYFPHTLQRTGNSQCQPALTAEYNHFRNSIQRYSAIGDNVFLRPIQSNPATGSISSLRLEDRTSGYCANLAITIRSTNPALAGRGATDNLMDERAEFVERCGSPSLTPR
jgi:hypothetical protein